MSETGEWTLRALSHRDPTLVQVSSTNRRTPLTSLAARLTSALRESCGPPPRSAVRIGLRDLIKRHPTKADEELHFHHPRVCPCLRPATGRQDASIDLGEASCRSLHVWLAPRQQSLDLTAASKQTSDILQAHRREMACLPPVPRFPHAPLSLSLSPFPTRRSSSTTVSCVLAHFIPGETCNIPIPRPHLRHCLHSPLPRSVVGFGGGQSHLARDPWGPGD